MTVTLSSFVGLVDSYAQVGIAVPAVAVMVLWVVLASFGRLNLTRTPAKNRLRMRLSQIWEAEEGIWSGGNER